MGTIVVSAVLLIVITSIIISLCKKHIRAKKTGSCCCGCSGCSECGTK